MYSGVFCAVVRVFTIGVMAGVSSAAFGDSLVITPMLLRG